MMDSIFMVYIRRGDTGAFIDDIGIATGSDPKGELSDEEFHIKVVREILQVFREHKLFLKAEKCEFLKKQIAYLGYIISEEGIKPDPVKVHGVKDWPTPTNLKTLRSFLGFLNYYRRFIMNYSAISRPLNDLMQKDKAFEWKDPQQGAFDKLKELLTNNPILVYPDQEKPFLLETDASDFAYGAVISQQDDENTWRPVGYISHSFTAPERNYEVHDKELLAIIRTFEEWRSHLSGTKYPVTVLTDHANLTYFRRAQNLNRRRARWANFLENFNFKFVYRPARLGAVPDLLSRREDHDTDKRKDDNKGTILLPDHLFPKEDKIQAVKHSTPAKSFDLRHEIFLAQARDPLILDLNKTTERTKVPLGWSRTEDLWTYHSKIYIPSILRQTVFRILHSDPSAAHPGRDATLFSIKKSYYWPNLRSDVEEWVRNCDVCQHVKIFPRKPHGQLKPIDVITRPWSVVTSDLITGLPPCKGFDSIWTATCKRTKAIHCAATTSTLDSRGLYQLYLENVWKLHGTQDKLITDRGPQYSSRFAKEANRNLQIETALSTAYHPQTDGQSERTNQEVEQALRAVVNFHQNDWVDWLPVIEFALNNRYKKSLGTTPFYANYGFHPQIDSLPRIESPLTSVEDFVKHIQKVQEDTKSSLTKAAEDMKRFYDRHRAKTPEYEVGQKVLLDNSNLALDRPTRKLAERRSGPFKIIERIGTHAYRLELPLSWKSVHPVFHVSLLNPYHEDPENPNFTNPPPDIIEGEPEYEVEAILGSKFVRNKLQFLVKWKNYPDSENSWEHEVNVENAKDALADFYKSHPGAPRRLPGGSKAGTPVTSKRKRKTKIRGMTFTPLHIQTDVAEWPKNIDRLF
jgi:hypothetical protein